MVIIEPRANVAINSIYYFDRCDFECFEYIIFLLFEIFQLISLHNEPECNIRHDTGNEAESENRDRTSGSGVRTGDIRRTAGDCIHGGLKDRTADFEQRNSKDKAEHLCRENFDRLRNDGPGTQIEIFDGSVEIAQGHDVATCEGRADTENVEHARTTRLRI